MGTEGEWIVLPSELSWVSRDIAEHNYHSSVKGGQSGIVNINIYFLVKRKVTKVVDAW